MALRCAHKDGSKVIQRSLLLAYLLDDENREIDRTLVERVVSRDGQVEAVTLKV